MGAPEVTRFLSSLAVQGKVAASTQNQALSALLFLYRHVRHQDLPWLDDVVRAKQPKRLPIVLTRDEVRAVVSELHGTSRLMATLLYGSGLRLLEGCRLRVQDIDFAMNQIVVRDGKGAKDRVTVLPAVAKAAVVGLLAALESGRVDWVASAYLDFEVEQDPDGERVRRVRSLLRLVHTRIPASWQPVPFAPPRVVTGDIANVTGTPAPGRPETSGSITFEIKFTALQRAPRGTQSGLARPNLVLGVYKDCNLRTGDTDRANMASVFRSSSSQ